MGALPTAKTAGLLRLCLMWAFCCEEPRYCTAGVKGEVGLPQGSPEIHMLAKQLRATLCLFSRTCCHNRFSCKLFPVAFGIKTLERQRAESTGWRMHLSRTSPESDGQFHHHTRQLVKRAVTLTHAGTLSRWSWQGSQEGLSAEKSDKPVEF